MSDDVRRFLERHIKEVLSKFFSSFFTSNLEITKRANKLHPSIINYSKNEIKRRNSKAKAMPDIEKFHLAIISDNQELHEIISINAIAAITELGCI